MLAGDTYNELLLRDAAGNEIRVSKANIADRKPPVFQNLNLTTEIKNQQHE